MLILILSFFLNGVNAAVPFQAEAMTTDQLISDDQWWQIYWNAFPEPIRTKRESIIKYNRQGSGTAVRVTHSTGQTVGMATYLFLDDADAAYLMYFAISPAWVQQGAGTEVIRFVQDQTSQYFAKLGRKSLGIVLEAEIPANAETPEELKLRQSRLQFYNKMGGQVLREDYVMPPVHDGLPATVMQLVLLPPSDTSPNNMDQSLPMRLTHAIYQKCFPSYFKSYTAKK